MIDRNASNTEQVHHCTYEQPLSERTRLFMRLESMFAQMRDFHRGNEYYAIQLFLDALFDVLDFFHRYEIRSEILNELQRLQTALMRDKIQASTAMISPSTIKETIDSALHAVYEVNLNQISKLRENELLNSLRQRNFNNSGSCLFEVPAYQFSLIKNSGRSSPFLIHCHSLFTTIIEAIELLLKIIRTSVPETREYSEDGMFLRTLDRNSRYQMLRVHLPSESNVFPRISGNSHRLAIRFMEQDDPQLRSIQARKPVTFSLQICAL